MPRRFPKFGGAADSRRMEGLTARSSAPVPYPPVLEYRPQDDTALTQSGDRKFNSTYIEITPEPWSPLGQMLPLFRTLKNTHLSLQRNDEAPIRVLMSAVYATANGFMCTMTEPGAPGENVRSEMLLTVPLGAAKLLMERQPAPFRWGGHKIELWRFMSQGRADAPEPAPRTPAPDAGRARALALAKAKVIVLALAKAKARARGAITESTTAGPDYDLERTPDAWKLPAAWAGKMPANHFAFLQAVTDRQRIVGGTDTRGRWNPLKEAAAQFSITQMHVVRELIELSTVHLVRTTMLPLRRHPGAEFRPFLDRLVALYNRQFSLGELKTATTLLNQQYSTPGPLSALLGEWIARKHPEQLAGAYEGAMELPRFPYVLEPTAGNGLLTTRFEPGIVAVNELEPTRLAQLKMQPFYNATGNDAADEGVMAYSWNGPKHQFLGVITNPPFGSTDAQIIKHRNGGAYRMTGWEHVIAARAVCRMADNGRAAIIIGGHHQYDLNGKLVGRDWVFFNWLYSLFNDVRVYQLDANKLYARQGATWPIRVITLDGCGKTGEGIAPRGVKDGPLPLITSFYQLAHDLGLISSPDA